MKTTALLSALFIFTVFIAEGQQIALSFNKSDKGEELYLSGTQLVELGKYKEAESLLTQALCTYKNEDVFFNRGISRLYMADTSGFCEDMQIASNKYFDTSARQLFNKLCCYKVDTLYYNKKFQKSTGLDYRFLEEIQFIKKTGEEIGTVHQRGLKEQVIAVDYGCDGLLGMNSIKSDVIALYKLIDSVKFYYKATDAPFIQRVHIYNEMKEKFKSYCEIKYKSLKELNAVDKISVYYELRVSDNGDIIDGKYQGIFPAVSINGYEKDLDKDIKDVIKHYPRIKPATFRGKNVNSFTTDVIEF